jgi:hypothetical protein
VIDLVLAGGPVVVAGLGLAVAHRILGATAPRALVTARRLQPPAAVAAVASLAMAEGSAAGALAVPWAIVGLCTAAAGVVLVGHVASGAALDVEVVRWPLALVTLAAATVDLAAGGVLLVVGRLGLHPFDLSTEGVQLGAMHLHYAGFGLTLLAATGLACADWMGRSLLVVSALAPVVPMLLAVQWAVAQHADVPSLSVMDMASTHGVLNGIGFVMIGLTGWLLAGVSSPETHPALAPHGAVGAEGGSTGDER